MLECVGTTFMLPGEMFILQVFFKDRFVDKFVLFSIV